MLLVAYLVDVPTLLSELTSDFPCQDVRFAYRKLSMFSFVCLMVMIEGLISAALLMLAKSSSSQNKMHTFFLKIPILP